MAAASFLGPTCWPGPPSSERCDLLTPPGTSLAGLRSEAAGKGGLASGAPPLNAGAVCVGTER